MSASVGVYVATAIFLAVSTAQAQPPMPSHYSSLDNGIKADLYLHKNKPSLMEIKKETCVGGVEGSTKIMGRAVVLREGDCELRITFNRNYTRASVKEKNCTNLHGASCQFGDGPVLRRRK
jgi:hypothetical protein